MMQQECPCWKKYIEITDELQDKRMQIDELKKKITDLKDGQLEITIFYQEVIWRKYDLSLTTNVFSSLEDFSTTLKNQESTLSEELQLIEDQIDPLYLRLNSALVAMMHCNCGFDGCSN